MFDKCKSILIDTLPNDLREIIQDKDKYGLLESIYNPEIQEKDAFNWIEEEIREDYSHLRFIIKFDNKYYRVYWTRYRLNWDEPFKNELWERLWEVALTPETDIYNLVLINQPNE